MSCTYVEQERASVSTHAIMDKVREMNLYPVVLAEGKFASSKRLMRAMEIAHQALRAPETHLEPPPTRPRSVVS
jgi:hypothetical protein